MNQKNDLPAHKIQTKNLILNYLKKIDKSLSNSSSKYDNFMFLDDLTIEPTELTIRDFWNVTKES